MTAQGNGCLAHRSLSEHDECRVIYCVAPMSCLGGAPPARSRLAETRCINVVNRDTATADRSSIRINASLYAGRRPPFLSRSHRFQLPCFSLNDGHRSVRADQAKQKNTEITPVFTCLHRINCIGNSARRSLSKTTASLRSIRLCNTVRIAVVSGVH